MIFIQDECGFGGYHSHLRHYGYALKGKPATTSTRQLHRNLTLNCTISLTGIELYQFFSSDGSRISYFSEYFG